MSAYADAATHPPRESTPPASPAAEPAPAVRITQLMVCPHCDAVDSIQEEDVAHRFNDLSLDGTGRVFASLGDSDFHHHRYLCNACGETVSLPWRVEDYS